MAHKAHIAFATASVETKILHKVLHQCKSKCSQPTQLVSFKINEDVNLRSRLLKKIGEINIVKD
jgi:hypothetical protein